MHEGGSLAGGDGTGKKFFGFALQDEGTVGPADRQLLADGFQQSGVLLVDEEQDPVLRLRGDIGNRPAGHSARGGDFVIEETLPGSLLGAESPEAFGDLLRLATLRGQGVFEVHVVLVCGFEIVLISRPRTEQERPQNPARFELVGEPEDAAEYG
jgi:hypothetical protein